VPDDEPYAPTRPLGPDDRLDLYDPAGWRRIIIAGRLGHDETARTALDALGSGPPPMIDREAMAAPTWRRSTALPA
jgi:hypothetical protein